MDAVMQAAFRHVAEYHGYDPSDYKKPQYTATVNGKRLVDSGSDLQLWNEYKNTPMFGKDDFHACFFGELKTYKDWVDELGWTFVPQSYVLDAVPLYKMMTLYGFYMIYENVYRLKAGTEPVPPELEKLVIKDDAHELDVRRTVEAGVERFNAYAAKHLSATRIVPNIQFVSKTELKDDVVAKMVAILAQMQRVVGAKESVPIEGYERNSVYIQAVKARDAANSAYLADTTESNRIAYTKAYEECESIKQRIISENASKKKDLEDTKSDFMAMNNVVASLSAMLKPYELVCADRSRMIAEWNAKNAEIQKRYMDAKSVFDARMSDKSRINTEIRKTVKTYMRMGQPRTKITRLQKYQATRGMEDEEEELLAAPPLAPEPVPPPVPLPVAPVPPPPEVPAAAPPPLVMSLPSVLTPAPPAPPVSALARLKEEEEEDDDAAMYIPNFNNKKSTQFVRR